VSSKCFQLYYTCTDRLFAIVLPSCSFHFFPSYSDVSEIRSYFASTVQLKLALALNEALRQAGVWGSGDDRKNCFRNTYILRDCILLQACVTHGHTQETKNKYKG
jgi:hypothetical protein